VTSNHLLIESRIALRWRDLDALNHVNNSTFLTYIEEARLQWMARLSGAWEDERCSPLLAAVHVNYRRPLNWPAEVFVELSCGRLGNTSVTLTHRIVDASDRDVVYADGESVMVWVDPATGKPVPLPAAVRAACQ
jgi:acyl-CoA thioester hydrolase